jgi:hypothetical protein
MRDARSQQVRRAAHKIRSTCYNEKSYECNMFAISYLPAVSAVWSRRTGCVVSGRLMSWSGTGGGVAGTYVTPRPREVPLKVRYPGRAVVKAVLGDDVLLVRRRRPLVHVRLQLANERRRRNHALTRPPSIDET